MKRLRALWNRVTRASRARKWRQMTAGCETVMLDAGDGITLETSARSDLARMIFVDELEAEERQILSRLLRPGDFFIDVGANFGLYSVKAGKCVGDQGLVWSFEPAAETFASLDRNVKLNRLANVHALRLAISDFDGEAELKVSVEGRDGWNTLGASLHESAHGMERVPCARLDSAIKARPPGRAPAMMKVDVEGWEWHVMRGAEELLARDDAPMLQVEFAPAYFTANGSDITTLRDEITRHGYEFFAMTGHATLRRFAADRDELAGNLYAVKPQGPWRSRFESVLDRSAHP